MRCLISGILLSSRFFADFCSMAALAVSPKPKELAMTNDAVQKQYYLDIEGEQVAVSKEVYLAYMQPVWREQKRVERQKRCIDENGRRCMKDCSQCPKTPSGGVLSLEKFMTDGLDFSSSDNVEEECVRRDLRQAIRFALGALSNSDREIFLRAVAGYKEREIANFLHMSQTNVNRRKRVVFEYLRKQLEAYR